jgi:hypothetical protein
MPRTNQRRRILFRRKDSLVRIRSYSLHVFCTGQSVLVIGMVAHSTRIIFMMMCWNVDIATYIHLKWFSSSTRIATEKNKRWERIAIRGLSRPRGLITQQHAHSNMCLQLEMETAAPTYALNFIWASLLRNCTLVSFSYTAYKKDIKTTNKRIASCWIRILAARWIAHPLAVLSSPILSCLFSHQGALKIPSLSKSCWINELSLSDRLGLKAFLMVDWIHRSRTKIALIIIPYCTAFAFLMQSIEMNST